MTSFNLWISNRFFPLVPVVDCVSDIGLQFSLALVISLIFLLVLNILLNQRLILAATIGLLLVLGVQDQMRWQPWVYIYTLILVCFLFNKEQNWIKSEFLSLLQFILIGIYIWSGIHKLNVNFIELTYSSILTDFLRIKDFNLINYLKKFGYIIPVIEILIGVALLIPKTRKLGVYIATLTHIFILLYLSPLGINFNSVVYPWNVAMIILVYLLFFRTNNKLQIGIKKNIGLKVFNLFIATLVWIAPILNFTGYWDSYLSFSLYSDKNKDYYIAIAENEIEKIDKRLHAYFIKIDGMTGGEIIDVNKWSLAELNVPFYPERRVFKKISKTFCNLGIKDENIIFLEFERPIEKGKYYKFTCKDILTK